LDADRRVYTQGIRNLNDGLSALNLAESALDSLTSIVIRLQELAEQSANGVYGTVQRKSLDAEAQALSKEYFRISKSVKFNGLNLFDGSVEELRLQAGYGLDGGVASGVGGAIGTGSFGEKRTFCTTEFGSSKAVSLGDVNGDGILDMVTAGAVLTQGQASVLIGRGDGTFGDRRTYTMHIGGTSSQCEAVTLRDVNGDGILDLVAAGVSNHQGQVIVLIGNGDGTFGDKRTFATETGTGGHFNISYAVSLGDVNGDGVLDLVTAGNAHNGSSQGQVSILIGNGDGTFGDKRTFATETGSSYGSSRAVTLGDVNGDGILDLVTAGNANSRGQASVLIGRGDGTFGEKRTFATEVDGVSWAVTLGDVNGDGVLDLVSAGSAKYGGSSQSQTSVMIGRGDGTFGDKRTFATETGNTSFAVSLEDVNGDGVLDLVTAGGAHSSVLIGNGDSSFGDKRTFATDVGSDFSLGDVNGDGVLDLVTAGGVNDQGQATILTALTKDGVSPLLPFFLSTMADARQALPVFQQKLSQLGAQRGQIGAFQSRLSVAVNVLSSSTENIAAATGRIRDVDVAKESANLVRNQILQQAGAAVLAQANQQSALVLKLLDSN
ncbi:MAG: hypothetical protein GX589_00830, partial [Deltaproteobacteria bacterium]|nr:hypothetical protein [Deltaproteobacteria bacterium]